MRRMIAAGMMWGVLCAGQQCGSVMNDTNCWGSDVANQPNPSGGIEGCCKMCAQTAGCTAVTQDPYNGGTCYMKSSCDSPSQQSGRTSAKLAPAPPPTPPTPPPGPSPPGPSTCASVLNDTNCNGDDISNHPSSGIGACCQMCRDTPGCVACTQDPYNGGTCFLKSGCSDPISQSGRQSAFSGPTPPPP
eukprot:Hpha_TRINITY_DN25474_c0_g1::TRINITY_DN25474_c0_g1_i1::g.167702::m.167702